MRYRTIHRVHTRTPVTWYQHTVLHCKPIPSAALGTTILEKDWASISSNPQCTWTCIRPHGEPRSDCESNCALESFYSSSFCHEFYVQLSGRGEFMELHYESRSSLHREFTQTSINLWLEFTVSSCSTNFSSASTRRSQLISPVHCSAQCVMPSFFILNPQVQSVRTSRHGTPCLLKWILNSERLAASLNSHIT